MDSSSHTIWVYGYIWWLKSITQSSNLCGASPVNNQIILFYGNDSHFGDSALIHMEHQNIQPLVMKLGDSVNDQINDYGFNSKLKSH